MNKVLIAEDEMIARKVMKKFLSYFADCDVAVDGLETLNMFIESLQNNEPYDLICLDIMMPHIDGLKVLESIRSIEKKKNINEADQVKVIMTTALNDKQTVMNAYGLGCVGFAWKPIDLVKLQEVLVDLGLIKMEEKVL